MHDTRVCTRVCSFTKSNGDLYRERLRLRLAIYIELFWHIGVVIIKSFEDVGIKNVSPARECDVYPPVYTCVRASPSYFLHESTSRISLSLTCCSSRFTIHPHARMCTHTQTHRVFAEWTIDYAFASITRLRCTLSFRPISRPVPFTPDSSVEIKGDLEMRARDKEPYKRRKYFSKSHSKKVVLRTKVLLQLYSGMF